MSNETKQAEVEVKKVAAVQPVKLNAAQKIEALEDRVIHLQAQINELVMIIEEKANVLADEIDRTRQISVALNKRLNASIQAAEEGGLNGASVNKIILDENQKELASRIQFLLDKGALTRDDETPIDEKSFVVGRTIDAEGNVVNPRLQFAVATVEPELSKALMGKKLGEVVGYSEGEDPFEITEVYRIANPSKNENYEENGQ